LSDGRFPNTIRERIEFIKKLELILRKYTWKEINLWLISALENVLANEANLNHLTSEAEIFIGRAMIIFQQIYYVMSDILIKMNQFMIGFTKDTKLFPTSKVRTTMGMEEINLWSRFFVYG
jgi:hypothetical protein